MTHQPDSVELLHTAAECVRDGQLHTAEQIYLRLLAAGLRHCAVYNNLGIVLQKQGRLDEAARSFLTAIELDPRDAASHVHLGVARFEQGSLAEAAASFEVAVALDPRDARAHNNLGYARYCMGQYSDAERCYASALALDPEFPDANWNVCMLRLLRGELEIAWETFHYRHTAAAFPRRATTRPAWEGKPLSGETVLLYKEHGLGDTIQFARYARCVAERGASVVFEVQPELMRVFQTLPGVDLLVTRGGDLSEYDFECSLMDLPHIFRTTLTSVPAAPYLSANPVLARFWRKRVRRGFSVGLVWAGNPRHANDRNRSIALAQLAALASCRGVTWVSLQKGAESEAAQTPRGLQLQPIGEQLEDFADTAAVIENLDLVISVDTSVAHLAGALGKPVWLLLPYVPDWRWLLEREDSPWYPAMKLFRQTEPGNWGPVIERVVRELHEVASAQKPIGLAERLRHFLFSQSASRPPHR